MPRYREARAHAAIAAIVLWGIAVVGTLAGSGERNLAGRLKGSDFVQLYTLAHVALEGTYPGLDDADALHRRQIELVPSSGSEFYLPVYPPQAALLFAPLTVLPYIYALAVWTAILIAGYGTVVAYTWRSVRDVVPDKVFVAGAAAAFPPFVNLVLYGQTTIVPLVAFACAWAGLARNRPFVAGAALSLLTIKPQFGIVVAFVVILGGHGRIVLGGLAGLAVQVAAVIQVIGAQALAVYYETVRGLSRVEHLLEPDAWRMHSLRAVTDLLPAPSNDITWVLLSAITVAIVVRAWRTRAPLAARCGVLVLGTVLVNPHLFIYDAAVLALPFLWLGGWMEQHAPAERERYWAAVYVLFLLLLFPTAAVIRMQASVVVLVLMLCHMAHLIGRAEGANEVSVEAAIRPRQAEC